MHLQFDDIRSYIEGKCSRNKILQIEKHLADCPLCSDAVEGYSLNPNWTNDEKLVQKINNSNLKMNLSLSPYAPILGVAASLTILFYIGYNAFKYEEFYQNEKIYTEHYQALPNMDITVRGGNETSALSTEMKNAMNYYAKKDYLNTIRYLEIFLKKDPGNLQAYLYMGIAYMELDDEENAEKYLLAVRQANEGEEYLEAAWYLALLYIKNNENKKAVVWLNTTMDENGFYAPKAKELLTNFN